MDDIDFDSMKDKHWNCRSTGCVFCSINGVDVPFANFLLMVPEGKMVDHRDLNGHNNQRANLRVATKAENNYNRGPNRNSKTGIKGVFFCKATKRYRVQIKKGEERFNIGRFDTLEEATKAYNESAEALFGEFAYLNPLKQPTTAKQ